MKTLIKNKILKASIFLFAFAAIAHLATGFFDQTVEAASNTVDKPIALFQTSLATAITPTATAMTLVSGLTNDGTTLSSSTYGFIIDEGTSVQEFVRADCTNTVCQGMQRGISVVTGTSSVTALQFAHRRGASVKITDAPLLLKLTSIITGAEQFPNVLSYASNVAIATSSNQLVHSNYLNANYMDLSNNQTANGNKTFTGNDSFTKELGVGTPTASTSAANKGYVDGVAIAGAPNASTTVKGLVQQATQAQLTSHAATGSTAAPLFINPSDFNSSIYVPRFTFVATTSSSINVTLGSEQPNFILWASGSQTACSAHFTILVAGKTVQDVSPAGCSQPFSGFYATSTLAATTTVVTLGGTNGTNYFMYETVGTNL